MRKIDVAWYVMSVNVSRRNMMSELKQIMADIDEVMQDCYETLIEPNSIEYDDYYTVHCAYELLHYQELYGDN